MDEKRQKFCITISKSKEDHRKLHWISREIVKVCCTLTEFLKNKMLEKQSLIREELVAFCRQLNPLVKENIKNAAISEIDE